MGALLVIYLTVTCPGCHWTHPYDAVTFPLGLVGVDCHCVEFSHLGNSLTQQISPQFAVYKHHHRRVVQLTVL